MGYRRKKRGSGVTAVLFVAVVAFFVAPDVLDKFWSGTKQSPVVPQQRTEAPREGVKSQLPWPYLTDDAQSLLSVNEMMRGNYYVLMDGSGSMAGMDCVEKGRGLRKIDVAKEALVKFAELVPADANMGLASFDISGVKERLTLAVGNRQQFYENVYQVEPGKSTPLDSAIKLSFDKLTAQAKMQLGYGEYHLVIVTDGEADRDEDPTRTVNRILQNSPVVVHTIGFCISTKHSLNQPGRTRYQSANSSDSLFRGLSDVLAESPEFSVSDFQ